MGESGKKPAIMIVDEDPTYLKVWEKVLRDLPADIFYVQGGTAQVDKILDEHPIALVISDIVMGTANGYDVAIQTHDHHPEAAILLTTAFECNAQNFDPGSTPIHVLYKPYRSIHDIQLLVRNLLNREEPSMDLSEDSFSENEYVPTVTEWHL